MQLLARFVDSSPTHGKDLDALIIKMAESNTLLLLKFVEETQRRPNPV
jgi:hypothetical protein